MMRIRKANINLPLKIPYCYCTEWTNVLQSGRFQSAIINSGAVPSDQPPIHLKTKNQVCIIVLEPAEYYT